MASVPAIKRRPRSGTFADGMDFLTFGSGPKTLLLIPGFPASAFRKGMRLWMSDRMFAPWLDAGFTVWMCDRRRHMLPGHTVADMADDYARLISEEFGGRVDLVVAEDFGGMIAQYLAAVHPGVDGHLAMTVTAAEMSDWGKDADLRLAAALARGDRAGAAAVFAESLVPGPHLGWLRRLIGAVIGRVLLRADYVPGDILVEAQAQAAFDSRAVLPRIQVPVLLACGDRDRFFPKEVAQETAKLIPDCTLIWYQGGLLRAASNKQAAHDVLAFVNRN
jgi:pimeloyl-ACP methyl ester carboxylesterase